MWQMMREHIIQTLKSLSSDGKDISEGDMIKWANETLKRSGRSDSISNFKDSSLRTGTYLLNLLEGIKKGTVDFLTVTKGVSGNFIHNNLY